MPGDRGALLRLVEKQGPGDPRIIDALKQTDRAHFVPKELQAEAYLDRPVTLPFGQTTSQPSLIVHMIDAAAIGAGDTVLEIGTGFGFQTALLARVARRVVSVERIRALADNARKNLAREGIDNVEVLVGNGWVGAAERGPFEAIVVSAAAAEVPTALVEQLVEGGRLVVPLQVEGSDDVVLFRKVDGELTRVRLVTPARFVPLVQAEPE